jgi:hypothetical protein
MTAALETERVKYGIRIDPEEANKFRMEIFLLYCI